MVRRGILAGAGAAAAAGAALAILAGGTGGDGPDPGLGLVINTPGPEVTLQELDEAYREAASAGAGRSNVYMFWNLLEPEPGGYDWEGYDALMGLNERHGMRVTLYMSVINGRTLGPFPDWLGDPGLRSIPGSRLADTLDTVLSRYHIIDSVIIAAGTDEYFRHREQEIPTYAGLFDEVYGKVKGAHPGVKMGNSFELHNVLNKNLGGTVSELSGGDFVAFTYRPTDPLNEINRTPQEAAADLDMMSGLAPGRVALFEVSWSTAGEAGGSEEDQALFVKEVLSFYTENRDDVEFVTWYRLHDRPEGSCRIEDPGHDGPITLGNSTFVLQRLEGYICGAGLLGADGAPKPGWDAFAAGPPL
ncbi:hypothetical protein CENSYa_1769 [Cenarchaeum symbiosum A]|uniref:Uncharacterized protein n=1 Tax=Cenarchaeum symbiosum (strain A) TaxID=414004 RepID=A0RYG2_CENSY|nr:hypothetical protein CENSYa_1769 [Cenarchaeum symbiosum A]